MLFLTSFDKIFHHGTHHYKKNRCLLDICYLLSDNTLNSGEPKKLYSTTIRKHFQISLCCTQTFLLVFCYSWSFYAELLNYNSNINYSRFTPPLLPFTPPSFNKPLYVSMMREAIKSPHPVYSQISDMLPLFRSTQSDA